MSELHIVECDKCKKRSEPVPSRTTPIGFFIVREMKMTTTMSEGHLCANCASMLLEDVDCEMVTVHYRATDPHDPSTCYLCIEAKKRGWPNHV